MLVLTGGKGQKIIINPGQENETVVTLLGHKNGQFRVGFNAPLHVQIVREKVLARNKENEQLKNQSEVGRCAIQR